MNIFQEEVLKIESAKKCLQTSSGNWNLPLGDVYFGVPESTFFGWTRFEALPVEVKGFNFYLGSDCLSLLKAFLESEFTHQVERLAIGDCSYALGSGMDYTEIANILAEAEFPKLKVFEFGIWELFSNSHCLYGQIGNVTKCLQRMPRLERLSLYGAFQMDEVLSFPNLRYLKIMLDDYVTGVNGGFITQETLDNLLSSDFPSLNEAIIDLECEDNDQEYTVSELFLSGQNVPKLQKMGFSGGYKDGEMMRVYDSELCRRDDVVLYFD